VTLDLINKHWQYKNPPKDKEIFLIEEPFPRRSKGRPSGSQNRPKSTEDTSTRRDPSREEYSAPRPPKKPRIQLSPAPPMSSLSSMLTVPDPTPPTVSTPEIIVQSPSPTPDTTSAAQNLVGKGLGAVEDDGLDYLFDDDVEEPVQRPKRRGGRPRGSKDKKPRQIRRGAREEGGGRGSRGGRGRSRGGRGRGGRGGGITSGEAEGA